MKTSILKLAIYTCLSSAMLTGCSSSAEKVQEAKNDVNVANQELAKANEEYLKDIETYRKETADRIAANEKSVEEFNARINSKRIEVRAEYREKMTELQHKNSDYKKRIDDYKADGKENWEKFKKEFNHDMDELGNAFRDLMIQNTKTK